MTEPLNQALIQTIIYNSQELKSLTSSLLQTGVDPSLPNQQSNSLVEVEAVQLWMLLLTTKLFRQLQ